MDNAHFLSNYNSQRKTFSFDSLGQVGVSNIIVYDSKQVY